jgi:hypothetical protein
MRHTCAIVTLTGLLIGSPPQAVPDLSKVDRTIVKEPSKLSQPRYCLMVFGPRAEVRIWMIKDGERLYVDRNANGDLTEADESFAPTERRQFNTMEEGKPAPYRQLKYDVGDLTPAHGARKHTRLEIIQYQIGDAPPDVVLSVFVDGSIKEYAGWSPLFHESRERAGIVHFGGPMSVQPIRYRSISRRAAHPELHLRFGMPGLERTTFASLAYEAVPESIHPSAEIEWPRADPKAAPIKTTVILSGRC